MANLSSDKQTQSFVMGGGHLPKHFLKKLYFKNLFLLTKAYKRYYFGIWLIKLPFYKLILHKDKTQKWEQKRKERYEFLQNSLKNFKKLKKIYFQFDSQMKAWLNSKEFKEKYIDTKHPYPPLLNPNDIDYEAIPAELAWEMNLPLPRNYDLLYITNGASGLAATCTFLKKCKVNVELTYGAKNIYIYNFNTLKANKKTNNAIYCDTSSILDDNDGNHLVMSFFKRVPLLHIARDPIEKIRTTANHIDDLKFITPISKYFNLTCKYAELFPKPTYWGGFARPNLKCLQDMDANKQNWYTSRLNYALSFDSLYNIIKDKIQFVYCIEFNDLKPDKAFNTFCNLADFFAFQRPKYKDEFLNRISFYSGLFSTLPATLYVHPDDLSNVFKEGKEKKQDLASLYKKGGFSIIIASPHHLDEKQKEFANISDEIYPNLTIDNTQIVIIIDKDELVKLKRNMELFDATKNYLKGYIDSLKDSVAKIKASLISEEQILAYLRQNDKARRNLKKILDNELNYIKKNHYDFIQKWKYYLEFEKMCAELDSKESK